ncbi:AraC family transcriptional regulator [Staphylococcus shinii]|mgnify:FL=1|uniref:AraC family transcriptional regulator n=1 Tax=Staphylococcus shinii TaxID=2912228 RepID=UPI003F8407BD
MDNEIIIGNNREEYIQYPDYQWKHVILHTTLSQTLLGHIPLHWHHALQFVYVINGKIKVNIGDNIIVLKERDGIFINADTVHDIHDMAQNSNFYCWNIEQPDVTNFIEYKYVNYIIELTKQVPYIYLSYSHKQQRELLKIIEYTGTIYEKHENLYQLEVTIQFYNAIKWLLHHMSAYIEDLTYNFDNRVKQIIEYIHEHYSNKITLQQLSDVVHMSEAETIKLFKKATKQTPFEYIQKTRLEASIYKLNDKAKYTITDIAMRCGFSTTSYFIKLFKNTYGMTPKQYQKFQLQS